VNIMEKQISDLQILETYQNRQVILNYYQDEELLIQRDGFFFQSIKYTKESLSFLKINGTTISINLKEYPTNFINTDFQNYYTLRNQTDKLEIYFP
jgi:hypothetical protein